MKKILRKARTKIYFNLYLFGLSVYQLSFVSDDGICWKLTAFVHKHYLRNEYRY